MYLYGLIPTYDQCMELCNKYKSFSRSEQELATNSIVSFKYNIMTDLLHSWKYSNTHIERFGMNMRGISFIDSEIVCLPFPKFFNIGENESTMDINLESDMLFAYEKIDGSLMSLYDMGTSDSVVIDIKSMRSRVSDVAIAARSFLDGRDDIMLFCEKHIKNGWSPMFEYISNNNEHRIVISYDREDLIFLGLRNLETGKILFPHELDIPASISTPRFFSSYKDMDEYISNTPDIEGVVAVLRNGQIVKKKTTDYMRKHKVTTNCSDKSIIEWCINDTIDDVISFLQQEDFTSLADKLRAAINKFNELKTYITSEYEKCYQESIERCNSRKELALYIFNHSEYSSSVANYIMNKYNNKQHNMDKLINDNVIIKMKQYLKGECNE
jgi:T4 RnlA family RNA ligase